ncbi:hypothetical protein ACP70R_027753 [Stipagrostis hirtigluma subsp. patula]
MAGDRSVTGARRRRSPRPAAAAPLLLLLLAVSFGGHAAAEDAVAGAGAPAVVAAGADGMTPLQKHVAFFDRDHNGIVTFDETYEGLQAIGLSPVRAKGSAVIINFGLGAKTRPDPDSSRMDIYIANIKQAIHGSDTGSYDPEGRFIPEKLDEMFAKHGKTVPGAMTKDEIDEMLKANREKGDFKGWLGSASEWKLLFKVASDKDGLLRKETARGIYDGSLFENLAKQVAQAKKG